MKREKMMYVSVNGECRICGKRTLKSLGFEVDVNELVEMGMSWGEVMKKVIMEKVRDNRVMGMVDEKDWKFEEGCLNVLKEEFNKRRKMWLKGENIYIDEEESEWIGEEEEEEEDDESVGMGEIELGGFEDSHLNTDNLRIYCITKENYKRYLDIDIVGFNLYTGDYGGFPDMEIVDSKGVWYYAEIDSFICKVLKHKIGRDYYSICPYSGYNGYDFKIMASEDNGYLFTRFFFREDLYDKFAKMRNREENKDEDWKFVMMKVLKEEGTLLQEEWERMNSYFEEREKTWQHIFDKYLEERYKEFEEMMKKCVNL